MDFINQINEENYKDFIASHGKICDVELAKELLCKTTNAWLILDESVKSNPEVIMYYQPMGECYWDVWNKDLGKDRYEDMGKVFASQKGFTNTKSSYNSPKYKPCIEFPEDFDFEMYFKIQEELMGRYEYENLNHLSHSIERVIHHNLFKKGFVDCYEVQYLDDHKVVDVSFDYKGINFDSLSATSPLGYAWRGADLSGNFKKYDRSKLNNIVNNVYEKAKQKTK